MTSAEPHRKTPYAADLRWRIIWQRIGMEFSYRRIAAYLNVALETVYHINRRFIETGDVMPKKASQHTELRSLSHSDELFIIGLIFDSPSHYLSELCHAVKDICGKRVSPATVCKLSTSMDLHAKSYSMWQNRDHCSTVVSTWLKFKCIAVIVLSLLMKLDVAAKITPANLAML